jgi:hypothetical protein
MTPAPGQAAADFERARVHDRDATIEALRAELGGFESVTALSQLLIDVFGLLRTPVHPRHRGRRAVASTLAEVALGAREPLTLRGVLASPTAEEELPFFLRLAGLFRERVSTHLGFLLVRWENLDAPLGVDAFGSAVSSVRRTIAEAGWSEADVDPVEIETAELCAPPIVAPGDFADAWSEVDHAARGHAGDDGQLVRDVAWITAFYERQRSLSKHGGRQPLFDLAVRRGIGKRLRGQAMGTGHTLMLASELHHRFLPCYDAAFPILDVDVEAPMPGRAPRSTGSGRRHG